MFLTVAQAKASRLKEVAAACPNSDEFLSLVNTASEKLMRRGDWPGLLQPIHVCSFSGCVVFPRFVQQIRAINVCRHNVEMKNYWWEFFDDTQRHLWPNWCGPECSIVNRTRTPVFQDIMGDGRQLRFYPQYRVDVGKVIRVFGVDTSGIELRTRDTTTQSYADGVDYRLQLPFGTSLRNVRRIDRILMPPDLQGNVYAYAYNISTAVNEFVATYEPGDINPAFERYQLSLPRCDTTSGGCGCSKPIVALVKMRFVPARTDNDLILVENIEALKMMIQSIKAGEAGDFNKQVVTEKASIREMNLEMKDRLPDDQIPIDLGEMGGTLIGSQSCF